MKTGRINLILSCAASIALAVASPVRAEAEGTSAADGFVIIIKADNPLSEIGAGALKKLFMGQITQVGGQKLTYVRPKEKDVYGRFRELILRMSEQDEKTYWLKETFRGGVKFGKELDSVAAVVSLVESERAAIGIATRKAVAGKTGVKILNVTS